MLCSLFSARARSEWLGAELGRLGMLGLRARMRSGADAPLASCARIHALARERAPPPTAAAPMASTRSAPATLAVYHPWARVCLADS